MSRNRSEGIAGDVLWSVRLVMTRESIAIEDLLCFRQCLLVESRARAAKLAELGIGTRSDLEMRFGDYLPELAPRPLVE